MIDLTRARDELFAKLDRGIFKSAEWEQLAVMFDQAGRTDGARVIRQKAAWYSEKWSL